MAIDYHEVVKKLIGPITPTGERREDNLRFRNLEDMCDLVDSLLTDIDQLLVYKDTATGAKARAGQYASDFFDRILIEE